MTAANRIPAAPVVAVIRDYLGTEERRLNGTFRAEAAIYLLAERADMHGDTLQKIVVGRSKTIDFDVADRILCVLGKADIWYGELQDVYAQAMLDDERSRYSARASGSRVCARQGCSETFVPPPNSPRKIYCCSNCRSAEWKHKTFGSKTMRRGKHRALEALRCRNGHPRTKENTGTNSEGNRFCLICHKASTQRWEKEHGSARRSRQGESNA